MSIQPTQAVCPSNMHGATHHLIPKRVGSESSELTCIFCRQSESSIRAELAQKQEPPVQPSHVHVQTLTISPDLEVLFWTALFAPAGTPKSALSKIAAVIDQAISSEAMIKAWAASGMQAYPKESRTPEAGDAIFRAEVKRWSALVRENNIKAD